MKIVRPNTITLLILAGIFMLPGLAALSFYQHPQWLPKGSINKGVLLSPPQPLVSQSASSKWRLILWNAGNCDKNCYQQLDKLARVRLALGRRLYQVEIVLMITKPYWISDQLTRQLSQQDIHLAVLSMQEAAKQTSFTAQSQIFIANPENYLILRYDNTAKPNNIFDDLRHLLNLPDKKSG